eukprot:12609953-Heterocapsa_arctica.AAC.1
MPATDCLPGGKHMCFTREKACRARQSRRACAASGARPAQYVISVLPLRRQVALEETHVCSREAANHTAAVHQAR